MKKRTRIKSPIFSAKADGTIIRRGQLDTHQRMVKAIRELGLDPKQYFRDMKWRSLCRSVDLSL